MVSIKCEVLYRKFFSFIHKISSHLKIPAPKMFQLLHEGSLESYFLCVLYIFLLPKTTFHCLYLPNVSTLCPLKDLRNKEILYSILSGIRMTYSAI